MLIDEVRQLLRATGRPYIIENVVGAPLDTTLLLCGSMFGLQTSCGAQLRRHRLFESSVLLYPPGPCQHDTRTIGVQGHTYRNEATRWAARNHRQHAPTKRGAQPRPGNVLGGRRPQGHGHRLDGHG